MVKLIALLVVACALTLSGCNKRTPDNKTVHQGLTQPMTSASPDNCSSCHS